MKIAYTKDNSVNNFNLLKNDNNEVIISWNGKSSEMASLELSSNGIKKYLNNPKRLLTEANLIYVTIDNNGNLKQPIFRTIETSQTKISGSEFIKYKLNQTTVGQIYIPFADSLDDEYLFRLNINEENLSKLLEFFPNAFEVTSDTFIEFHKSISPSLKIISSSKSGDWTKIKVQLTLGDNNISKADVRVFAKSASGYIANREVYTDANGTAEFKVLPYGLEQGESMKAEFGFKYYSNLVSKDVQA